MCSSNQDGAGTPKELRCLSPSPAPAFPSAILDAEFQITTIVMDPERKSRGFLHDSLGAIEKGTQRLVSGRPCQGRLVGSRSNHRRRPSSHPTTRALLGPMTIARAEYFRPSPRSRTNRRDCPAYVSHYASATSLSSAVVGPEAPLQRLKHLAVGCVAFHRVAVNQGHARAEPSSPKQQNRVIAHKTFLAKWLYRILA